MTFSSGVREYALAITRKYRSNIWLVEENPDVPAYAEPVTIELDPVSAILAGGPDHERGKTRKYAGAAEVFGLSLGGQTEIGSTASWTREFGNELNKHWICGDTNWPHLAERVFAGA